MDRLNNPVRRYPWGSAQDIPEFRGLPGDGQPQAELWMGAHPGAPSLVQREGTARSLEEVIAEDPDAELGPAVCARFGPRLPFLLKVLAAERPLSLQVHPDLAHARAAYTAGRAAQQGRALRGDDPPSPPAPVGGMAELDYTDDNHKPELLCALRSGFEALCGFRPVAETIAFLDELAVPALAGYRALLADASPESGLRMAVTDILTGGADHSPAIAALGAAARRLAAGGGQWAAASAAYAPLAEAYPADPGVLVALLLNHVVLAEGEALFVGAGVAHCYLHGLGAEIMAASDNVLRAGLTSKRVNVPELLRVLDFRPAPLRILRPEPASGGQETYPVPVSDFSLGRLRLAGAGLKLPGSAPQIVLVIAGTAVLQAADGSTLSLRRGESAYLSARCTSVTAAGDATLLRATVGS